MVIHEKFESGSTRMNAQKIMIRLVPLGVCVTMLWGCGGGGSGSVGGLSTSSGGTSTTTYSKEHCSAAWGTGQASSKWVFENKGYLAYQSLNSQGDKIMDFSAAGYGGGGVAFPVPSVTVTVSPRGNKADDTQNIQNAINQVSGKATGANGFRGVVQLSAGDFYVSDTLKISASGVVLRGSGSDLSGSVIHNMSSLQNGSSAAVPAPGGENGGQTLLRISGSGSYTTSASRAITNVYVPSGATTLTLSHTEDLKVGDTILISRPVTSAWIAFMKMDNLGAGKNWMDVGDTTNWQRTITAISGNTVTFEVPLSDSIDATYLNPPGGTVSLYKLANPISQVGVEHIRFVGVPRTLNTSNNLLYISNVYDSWMNDVVGDNFTSGLTINGSWRLTARSVVLTHENNDSQVPCTGAKFAEFAISGSQILLDRSSSTGAKASFYYATTGERTPGPNVVLNFHGTPDTVCSLSSIQPHQRWATGLLVDGAVLAPNAGSNSSVVGSVDFINRGGDGSGQGWAMGWGVIWNTQGTFNVQSPPGSANWVIGSQGTIIPQTTEAAGIFDSPDTLVTPQSLYLAQLCQRLGPDALTNIGY